MAKQDELEDSCNIKIYVCFIREITDAFILL